MKKIIIISIIFLISLSSMVIPSQSKEYNSPGDFWHYLNYTDKIVYLSGVREGINMCIKQLTDHSPTQFKTEIDKSKFISLLEDNFRFVNLFKIASDNKKKFENLLEVFIKIMNDFYEDAANTYIPIANMCLIASRKLKGETIETILRKERVKALP